MVVNKNRVRRKSSSATFYVPFAVVFVAFLTVLGVSVFLRIVEIEVIGASLYNGEDLIKASGIVIGDNLLFLDINAAQQGIYRTMPYINDVIIEYRLPDKVIISVSETTALAVIDDLGSAVVIDSSGKVLERLDAKPAGLIETRGYTPGSAIVGSDLKAIPGDETRLRYMLDILAAIEIEGIQDDVTVIDVTNIAYISFVYLGRFTVIVGTPENVGLRLIKLPDIIADVEGREPRDENYIIHIREREEIRVIPDR